MKPNSGAMRRCDLCKTLYVCAEGDAPQSHYSGPVYPGGSRIDPDTLAYLTEVGCAAAPVREMAVGCQICTATCAPVCSMPSSSSSSSSGRGVFKTLDESCQCYAAAAAPNEQPDTDVVYAPVHPDSGMFVSCSCCSCCISVSTVMLFILHFYVDAVHVACLCPCCCRP
jgi:hypothetical protein